MKQSPLQLKWVTYPAASFEAVESFDGDSNEPITALVDAKVNFELDGAHTAFVSISNDEAKKSPYRFKLDVVCQFEFDLERAKEVYRSQSNRFLPPFIAVNVARILYAGAREMLSMLTARAPYQAAILDSVMLEPDDVLIGSEVPAKEILIKVFLVEEKELDEVEARLQAQDEPVSGKRKDKKKSA